MKKNYSEQEIWQYVNDLIREVVNNSPDVKDIDKFNKHLGKLELLNKILKDLVK